MTARELAGRDWPPEKALRELRAQLEALRTLKQLSVYDAEQHEEEWRQFRATVLTHAFGEASQNLHEFKRSDVRHLPSRRHRHPVSGIVLHDASEDEDNFQRRLGAFEANLKSSIHELEAMLPEVEILGAYKGGDEFGFYRDLKSILVGASKEIFIVDNYLSTEIFELYLDPIPRGIAIRVLTNPQVKTDVQVVADMFAKRGGFELRSSSAVHDRQVFVDDRGWIVGQSIKHAARKKPTYIVELDAALLLPAIRQIYENIWTQSTSVVKSP